MENIYKVYDDKEFPDMIHVECINGDIYPFHHDRSTGDLMDYLHYVDRALKRLGMRATYYKTSKEDVGTCIWQSDI